MASSQVTLRSQRSPFDKALLVDLGVLCGVILGYHYGVRPFAGIITERIGPLLESLRNAPHGVRYQVDALIQAYRMYQRRGSLVRTIAYYVPFLQPTPRITFGSLEDSNTHCTYIPRGFVSARKFIEEDTSETDESDYGESGLIHAFGPEEDLVSEEDARAESVSSSLWGSTDLTINFDLDIPRFHPKCSTPSLTQGSNESELHSNLESSTLNAATQAKVAALEHELSEMRIMIAKILATQTSLSVPSEVPATTEKPPVSLPPAPPPPPPPPPPPLPPAILVPSSKVINLRVGKPTEASLIKTVDKTPGNSQPATMSDVLKDLPSVRLRAVAKSPGGTPMRQPKKSNPSDPASMIAAALKKRFARMHSPGSEIEQSDSDEDKENAGGKSDSIIIDEFEDTSPEKPDCSVVRNRRNIFETKRFTQTNQKRIIVQHRNSLEQRQVPFDNRVNFPETY